MFPIVPSFTLDQAVDSVYAMEIVMDVETQSVPLPDWWRLDLGGCRSGQLSADLGDGGCADPWRGYGAAALQDYIVSQPGGLSNHARMLIAAATPTDSLRTLAPGVAYEPCRVLLATGATTSCSGCQGPGCVVLNSILIRRLTAAPNDGVLLQSTPGMQTNWAVWQNVTGADCASVPVRRSTWGAIKALYR